ncbi:O-antigen ligase family protein [Streptococcus suis]|uniref:O-antigen ligase family protein n=1 Tax=Streptococcus suis TaxID=1307 RepID=UPI000CF676AF|nr:O-antigen ligase family protein [Streptococcus suis]
MEMNVYKSSQLERVVAALYLYFLPLRMIAPLSFLPNVFSGMAESFDFVFHIIGLFLYLIYSHGVLRISTSKEYNLFNYFLFAILTLNLSSIIMANFIQLTYGNYAGESAYSGILGMLLYFTQYALIVAYNIRVFNVLTLEKIQKILRNVCLFLLMLGYFQIFVLRFEGFFRELLNTIDFLDILWPEDTMWKLPLTSKEGAGAGVIFGAFVLPYLLALYNKYTHKRYIIELLLWVPVLIMMNSTSAYFMVIAALIVFIFIDYQTNQRHSFVIAFVGFLVLMITVLSLVGGANILYRILPNDISYLILEKTTDLTNGSTVSRLVPIVTNWNIFLNFPLLGVGNGLQGYFYTTFFPEWAINVTGSDVMTFYTIAQSTIVNGGLFFPSLLSGYGIVGFIIFIGLVKRIINKINSQDISDDFFIVFYKIAVFAIIIGGFQVDFVGDYVTWFVLSVPFFYRKRIGNESL